MTTTEHHWRPESSVATKDTPVASTFVAVLYEMLLAAQKHEQKVLLKGLFGEQSYSGFVEYLPPHTGSANRDLEDQVGRFNELFVTLRLCTPYNGDRPRYVVVRLGGVESFEVVDG